MSTLPDEAFVEVADELFLTYDAAEAAMDLAHLITIEPDKRSGQPCIRGLRMTVQDVLDYLAGGMSPGEILADFPDLTAEDIRACLQFAANRERRLRVVPAA